MKIECEYQQLGDYTNVYETPKFTEFNFQFRGNISPEMAEKTIAPLRMEFEKMTKALKNNKDAIRKIYTSNPPLVDDSLKLINKYDNLYSAVLDYGGWAKNETFLCGLKSAHKTKENFVSAINRQKQYYRKGSVRELDDMFIFSFCH